MWRWNVINVNMLVIFQVYERKESEVWSLKFVSICLSLSTSVSFFFSHVNMNTAMFTIETIDLDWSLMTKRTCAKWPSDRSIIIIMHTHTFFIRFHIAYSIDTCSMLHHHSKNIKILSLYLSAGVYNRSSTAASWHDKVIGNSIGPLWMRWIGLFDRVI